MMILALESSAAACSCALTLDGIPVAQNWQRSGLTHSCTLMPMVDGMLRSSGHTLDEVDVVAVAVGPGSFTGLRIGVATAKGLAWPAGKRCAPCSTLKSMAWPLAHMRGACIIACMDARRSQFYTALFRAEGDGLTRLTPDGALSLEELCQRLAETEGPGILVGDGAQLCHQNMPGPDRPALAPPHLRWQSALGVAREAGELAAAGGLVSAADLSPVYHRLSQAERERLARMQSQPGASA